MCMARFVLRFRVFVPGQAVRACDADLVLNGIVGAAGLGPSLAALEEGRTLALANKETLVIGGPLVQAALARAGRIVPVDSEHSAALQCLGGRAIRAELRSPGQHSHR